MYDGLGGGETNNNANWANLRGTESTKSGCVTGVERNNSRETWHQNQEFRVEERIGGERASNESGRLIEFVVGGGNGDTVK